MRLASVVTSTRSRPGHDGEQVICQHVPSRIDWNRDAPPTFICPHARPVGARVVRRDGERLVTWTAPTRRQRPVGPAPKAGGNHHHRVPLRESGLNIAPTCGS